MTKLQEVYEKVGQSIWLDYIRRSMLESNEWQQLIDDGVRGMTSNPSIFAEAIGESDDYDADIEKMTKQERSVDQIYEALAIQDIQTSADYLRPVYDSSGAADGYVSLEASPDLAYDTEATINEVRRLFAAVDRPNLMIKVPATGAGIPAISALIADGINVNVTLMFSLKHYEDVVEAYIEGIERLLDKPGDVTRVASVASFFVSRVDTAVDQRLDALEESELRDKDEIMDAETAYRRYLNNVVDEAFDAVDIPSLRGKIGIANATMAYARYLSVFSSSRWRRLAQHGARPQRVLFGSTSVKDPAYPDTLYVDNLMGANTVNTMPPETIQAFRNHGTVSSGLTSGMEAARRHVNWLAHTGIDLDIITQQLQDDGVEKFATSFAELKAAIQKKREKYRAQPA